MLFAIKGLVIRESVYAESDKILTLLTAESGKISIHAYGARKYRNPHLNSAQLFCFSEFILDKKGDRYWLKESLVIESFYDIRLNLYKTAIAQYIMDIVNDVCVENNPEEVMLRLTLNALHMLINGKSSDTHVKAVYELRAAFNIGFMPDLVYCNDCGTYETKFMYFNIMDATLFCENCFKKYSDNYNFEDENEPEINIDEATVIIKQLPIDVVRAMRHIVYSNPQRIFSFVLSEDLYPVFADVCETYLLNHIERGFKTLEFYKNLL